VDAGSPNSGRMHGAHAQAHTIDAATAHAVAESISVRIDQFSLSIRCYCKCCDYCTILQPSKTLPCDVIGSWGYLNDNIRERYTTQEYPQHPIITP